MFVLCAADAADAAAKEVLSATVREMGGRRNLPAFQGADIAQPRFAAADAETAAEFEAGTAADADVEAELDAELGMDLQEPGPVDDAQAHPQQQ